MADQNMPHLKHHSWFLQQICSHIGSNDTISIVKADLNVLSETTAVVISGGLRISNGLKRRGKTLHNILVLTDNFKNFQL